MMVSLYLRAPILQQLMTNPSAVRINGGEQLIVTMAGLNPSPPLLNSSHTDFPFGLLLVIAQGKVQNYYGKKLIFQIQIAVFAKTS